METVLVLRLRTEELAQGRVVGRVESPGGEANEVVRSWDELRALLERRLR
jgi:hypothetical protein